MSRLNRSLVLWLPVAVWMTVIFFASTDAFSVPRTSRFLGPLLRWLLPSASPDTIGDIVVLIRKMAHAWEYGLLALLCWRALGGEGAKARWNRWGPRAAAAWGIATTYAATDEWHQSFVPSRGAAVGDVLIDSAGALVALVLLLAFLRFRRRRPALGERVGE